MRYVLADLPETGRWVVVDETSGRWVGEPTESHARAERRCEALNRADDATWALYHANERNDNEDAATRAAEDRYR